MARSFNLTAEINLRAPGNLKTVVAEIKRELGTVSANVNLKFDPKAARGLDSITKKLDTMNTILATARGNTEALNTSLQNLSSSLGNVGSTGSKASNAVNSAGLAAKQTAKNIKVAASGMEEFGKQAYLAVKRFAAFSFATSGIVALTGAITSGFKAFIEYDKQLVRLQQVTGKSAAELRDLESTIRDLAQNLGVSSATLTETAVTLAQAGFSAKEAKAALTALAKTELAPSFDDIRETTEGAIAAMRQFDIGAGDLEAALGSINAVAAAFAVEADDLIGAIQRTGGVFAAASKGVTEGKDALNEFLAIFTSVRQTTRESSETIATGLRTIFTRIQRAKTIEQLREFGIELTDLEGKFVGPYEAVKRLSVGLRQLDPRDIRFSSIVEELGGFRQIGKVIPLIQQFAVAQEALKVAQKGQGSLTDAQVIAQKSLANQIAKVREQFLKLIADVGKSQAFQSLFQVVTSLASGLISLAGAMKPILPILAIVGAVKGFKAIGDFGAGFFGSMNKSSARSTGENIGSSITGTRDKERSDTVVKAAEATRANTSALKDLTSAIDGLTNKIGSGGSSTTLNSGGKVLAFARGGVVPGSGNRDTVPAMLQPGEFVIRKKAVETIGSGNLHKMNKYAYGGKVKDLSKYYKSISNKKGYEDLENQQIIDNSIFKEVKPADLSTDQITEWRGSDIPRWKKFEYILSEKYKLGKPASPRFALLDFPESRSEAKFMKKGDTYDDPDSLKGNNEETIAAKNFLYENSLLSGQKNIKPDKLITRAIADKPVTTYWANPDLFKKQGLNIGGLVQKFAVGGKALGARSKFKELSSEEILQLSTPDLIAYGKALAQDIFTTRGAGMAVGNEFIEVPEDRIVPELESSLVTHMGKRGFWREKVAPFGKAIAQPKPNVKMDRKDALASQITKYADEVAAREQNWTAIKSGSDIDNYLLSKLQDPILSDYKTVRGGGSLSKQFHNTRLRKAVNEALENYDDFDYSPSNIDKLVSGMAAERFAAGGLIQKFEKGTTGYQGVQPISSDPIAAQSILDKLQDAGGSRRARELLTLKTIEQEISLVKTSGKRPQPSGVFDKTFLKSPDAVPFLSTLSSLADRAVELFEGTSAADFNLTPEQIAAARDVAIAGFQSDMKDLKSYYRLRKGVPLRVHTGIITPNKYPIIDELLEEQHMAQVRAAQKFAPGENITPIKKEDRQKFGESNLGGYNLEAILALLGSGDGKKTTQDAIDFASGLTPLAAGVFGVPPNIPTQAKLTVSSSNVTKALDGIIKTFAFGGKAEGPGFEEVRKQIMDKYPDIDFRISKRKKGRGFGYNLLGALKSDGGLLQSKGLKFEQPSNLQKLIESSDKMANNLLNPQTFALGGLAEATGEMQGLMMGLYGNRQKDEQQQTKPQKNFGKIALRKDANSIAATYFKNDTRNGQVSAYKMRDYLYYVGLSQATKGYGPRLYDAVMEAATEEGAMLTSDRNSVSGAAKKVWEYYFNNRGDVKKTPLKPDDWSRNQADIDPKLYGKPETWPPASDPAWILQSGYSKSPSLINDPGSVIRMDKQAQSGQVTALQYFQSKQNFAEGGFVKNALAKSLKTITWGKGPNAPTTTSNDPRATELFSKKSTVDTIEKELSQLGIGALKFIGSGKDSLAYDAGNNIVKFTPSGLKKYSSNIPEQLRPSFAKMIEGYGVEVMPKVDTNVTDEDLKTLQKIITSKGYQWGDAAKDNMGKLGDRLVVIDGDLEPLRMSSPQMPIKKFAKGGSSEDTVPALLTPGEFVINKKAAQKIGYARLNKLNNADKLQGYNKGGYVGVQRLFRGGVADIDAVRAKGTKLTDIKQAETEFSNILSSLGPEIQAAIKSGFSGIEQVKAGEKSKLGSQTFSENLRGAAIFAGNKNGMAFQIGGKKASATTETVAHETGHLADWAMGGGKGKMASETEGTFQFTVIEKVKKQMEQAFKKAGYSSEQISEYLGTNSELFAEFFAKASPNVRAIITSTTDAKEGIKALADHLGDAGYTYAGLEASDLDPSRPKYTPPKKPSLGSKLLGGVSSALSSAGASAASLFGFKSKSTSSGPYAPAPSAGGPMGSPGSIPGMGRPTPLPTPSPPVGGPMGSPGSIPGMTTPGGAAVSGVSNDSANRYFELKAKQLGMSVEELSKSLVSSAKKTAKEIQEKVEAAKIEFEAGDAVLAGADYAQANNLTGQQKNREQTRIVDSLASKLQNIDPKLSDSAAKAMAKTIAEGMSKGKSFEDIKKSNDELKRVMETKLDDKEARNRGFDQAASGMGLDANLARQSVGDNTIQQVDTAFNKFVEYMGGPLKATTRSLLVASNIFSAGAQLFTKGSQTFAGTAINAVAAGFKGGSEGAAVVAELDIQKQLNSAGKFAEGLGGKFTGLGQTLQKFSGSIQTAALVFATVSGAMKSFFNSIAQSRLDYSLEMLSKTTEKTTEAFKNFDQNPNNAANATIAREAMANEAQAAEGLRAQGAVDVQGPRTIEFLRKWDPTGISSIGAEQEKEARKAYLDFQARQFEQSGKLGDQRLKKVDSRDIEKTVDQANKDQNVIDRIAAELEDLQKAPVKDETAIKAKQSELSRATQSKADNMYKKSQRYGEIASKEGDTEALRQFYLSSASSEEDRVKKLAALNGQLGKTEQERAKNQKEAFDTAKRLAAAEAEAESRSRLLADATKTLSLQTENLLRTYATATAMLNRFADSINMIKESAGNKANALSGKAQIGNIDRTNENILGNIDAYSLEEVRSAAVQTGQLAGGGMAGETLQNQVLTAKVMQQALPEALASTDSENIGEVISKMETAFKAAGVEFSAPIKEELKRSLESEVSGRQGGSFAKLSSENDLIANVLKQTEAGLKAAQDFQKQYNDALSVAIDLQNNYAQALSESIEYQIKAAQIRADSAIALKETLGQTVTTEERNAAADMEVRALTSTNVIPGGTTDPEQIFQQLMSGVASQDDQKKELERRQQAFASSPTDANRDAVAAQLQAMAKQNVAVNNTRKALEMLANDGRKAANALKDLQEINRISEGATNFTRNVLTAGPEEQAKIAKQLDAFTKFNTGQATQGDLNNLEFRQNVFGGGDMIKSVLPKELADQLDAQTSLDMLKSMPGADQVLNKVIGRVGKEDITLESALKMKAGGKDPVQERYIKAYEDAVNVQAQAAKKLGSAAEAVANTFNDQMINVLNKIQTELPVILERAITSAMNPNASKAWKEMNNASKERQALDQKQAVSMGLNDTQFNAVSTAYDAVQSAKDRTAALEKSKAEAAGFTGPNAVQDFREKGGAKYKTFTDSAEYKRSTANEVQAQANFDAIAANNNLDAKDAMRSVSEYRGSSAYKAATTKIEEKRKLYDEARMGPKSDEPPGTLPQEVTTRNPDVAEKEKKRAEAAAAEERGLLSRVGTTAVVSTAAAVGGQIGYRRIGGLQGIRDRIFGGGANKPAAAPSGSPSGGIKNMSVEDIARYRQLRQQNPDMTAAEAKRVVDSERKQRSVSATSSADTNAGRTRTSADVSAPSAKKPSGSVGGGGRVKGKGGRATAVGLALTGLSVAGSYLFGSGSSEAKGSTQEDLSSLIDQGGGDASSIVLLLAKIEENTRRSGEEVAAPSAETPEQAQSQTLTQAVQQEFSTPERAATSAISMVTDAVGLRSAISDVKNKPLSQMSDMPDQPTKVKPATSLDAIETSSKPGRLMGGANTTMQLGGAAISAYNFAQTGELADAGYTAAGLLNAAGSVSGNRFLGAAGDAASFSSNAYNILSGKSTERGTLVQDSVSAASDAAQVGAQMAPEIARGINATISSTKAITSSTGAATTVASSADDAVKAAVTAVGDDAAKAVGGTLLKSVASKVAAPIAVADLAYGGYRGYNDTKGDAKNMSAAERIGFGVLTGNAHSGDSITGGLMGVKQGSGTDAALAGLESMGRGAAAGAAIGSVIPGAGTLVGAGVGAAVGGTAELGKQTVGLVRDRQNLAEAEAKSARMESSAQQSIAASRGGGAFSSLKFDDQQKAMEEASIRTQLEAAKRVQQSGGSLTDLGNIFGQSADSFGAGSLEEVIAKSQKRLQELPQERINSRERSKDGTWDWSSNADPKGFADAVAQDLQYRLSQMQLPPIPVKPEVAASPGAPGVPGEPAKLGENGINTDSSELGTAIAPDLMNAKALDVMSLSSMDASKSLDTLSQVAQQFTSLLSGGTTQSQTPNNAYEEFKAASAALMQASSKLSISPDTISGAPEDIKAYDEAQARFQAAQEAIKSKAIAAPIAPGVKAIGEGKILPSNISGSISKSSPQTTKEGVSFDDLSKMSDADMAQFMRTGINPKQQSFLEPKPQLALQKAASDKEAIVASQPQVAAEPVATEQVKLDDTQQKAIDADKKEKQKKVDILKRQVEAANKSVSRAKASGLTGEKSQAILDNKLSELASAEQDLDKVYEGENSALEEARQAKQATADLSGKKIQYTVEQATRPQTSSENKQQEKPMTPYEAQQKARRESYEADKKARRDAYSEATRPLRENQEKSLQATRERNKVLADKRIAARQEEMGKNQDELFAPVATESSGPGALDVAFGPEQTTEDFEISDDVVNRILQSQTAGAPGLSSSQASEFSSMIQPPRGGNRIEGLQGILPSAYAQAQAADHQASREAAYMQTAGISGPTPTTQRMADQFRTAMATQPVPTPLRNNQTPQYAAQTVAADQAASGNTPANPFTLSLDPAALAAFTDIKKSFDSFGSYVTQLSEAAAKLPTKIEIVGNTKHSIDIQISGAAALDMLDKKVKEYGETLLVAEIDKLRKEINNSFPGAVKATGSGGKSTNASGGGSNPNT